MSVVEIDHWPRHTGPFGATRKSEKHAVTDFTISRLVRGVGYVDVTA